MYHCRYRALTENGAPFYFTVQDVPVIVYPNLFLLANRPNTPLLKIDSMCLVMDHLPLAEGDTVRIGGREYVVTYTMGFMFVGKGGDRIPSNVVTSYQLMRVGTTCKAKPLFKYQDMIFKLPAFCGCADGKAVLSFYRELVEIDKIKVSAGITYKKQKIFFGDAFKGGEVIMWKGRPCVLREEGYIEFPTNIFLGGVGE